MKAMKFLLFGIVILIVLLLVFSLGPSGLYYDSAGCLYFGKFFLSHPGSLLSFQIPEILKSKPQFYRIPWIYYRPVERIIWTVCFFIFGPNTFLLGLLQKAVFLLSLTLIYKLGRLLSGWVAGLVGVIVFSSTALPYGLIVFHTWMATQFGLLFLLCGIYFTLKGFIRGPVSLIYRGIPLIFISWLTRESNLYISLVVILAFLFAYLPQRKDEAQMHKLRLIGIAFLAGVIVYGIILGAMVHFHFAGLDFHKPALANLIPNLYFYGEEIFSNINGLFMLICFGLLFVFKDRLQFISLGWMLASLIPLCLSARISKTYLFDFLIGAALFCGSGISLLFQELSRARSSSRQALDKPAEGQDNRTKQLCVLVILVLVYLFSWAVYINSKEIKNTINYCHYKLHLRQERLKFFRSVGQGQVVLVPDLKAKEYYGALAEVVNRQDIKIQLITSWADLKELISGENLLKNASFEDGFSQWECKMRVPGLIKIVENYGFEGQRSLLINASVLQNHSYDLIDCGQLFPVIPGETYIFGGVVKLDHLDEGVRFEVSAPAGFEAGCWQTDIVNGTGEWQFLFNSFTPDEKIPRKLFFYAVRSANLIRGKFSVDGVFVYRSKQPLLAFD
jgi:hypothetical protein